MTEREYRKLFRDSYSTIKSFAESRGKYYKNHVVEKNSNEEDEDENRATLIGNLVDCLLLAEHEFDNKFFLSSCTDIPSGLMLQFVEALYRRVRASVDEEGKLTRQFNDLLLEAYNDVKFDKNGNIVAFKRDSFEVVVGKFKDNVKAYFDEICAVRPNGLMVITPTDIENAEKVKALLRISDVTSQIINLKSNSRFIVHNQFPMLYQYKGLELKSLIDKLVIDLEEKTIQPYDLKCTWDVDNFYEGYYLYRKTYIQAGLYHIGLLMTFLKEEKFKGFKVLPMKFIVADPVGYTSPLIYELTEPKLMDAFKGFTYKWRDYKGIDQLIDEIKWHKETGIWNISKDNHANRGIVTLKEEA